MAPSTVPGTQKSLISGDSGGGCLLSELDPYNM